MGILGIQRCLASLEICLKRGLPLCALDELPSKEQREEDRDTDVGDDEICNDAHILARRCSKKPDPKGSKLTSSIPISINKDSKAIEKNDDREVD